MRKGVSPIVSAVLLIAFTLTVASISAPFFSQQVQKSTKHSSNEADKILKSMDKGLDIRSISYNRTSQNLSVAIQNTGSGQITNFSVTVYGDSPYHRVYSRRINAKGIKTVQLKAGDSWDITSVKASLSDYPVRIEEKADCRPAENNLVAYWPMDKGSGTNIPDRAANDGYANNAVFGNSSSFTHPIWISGVHGGALEFDGLTDFATVDKSSELRDLPDGLTVMAWGMQTDNMGAGPGTDDTHLFDYDITGYRMWGHGAMNFNIRSPSDSWQSVSSGSATFNRWYHLTGVVDNRNYKLYLYKNGKLVASKALPEKYDFDTGRPFRFARHSTNENFWPGKIDEVRIWNTDVPKSRIEDPCVLEN